MTLSKQEQDAIEYLRRHVQLARLHVQNGAITYHGLSNLETLVELIDRLIRENKELNKLRLPA